MSFPSSDRVVYGHNPLEQVLCQLKFPPVLRIESELPAKFQERVRSVYPVFSEPQTLSGGPELPDEIMRLVGTLMPIRPTRVYEFATLDGQWKLTLSRDFIALVCLGYERWEFFVDHLRGPLLALAQEYAPAFFSRVGLRYRNIIKRSALGLKGVPWSELLKPPISAELGSPIADSVEEAVHQIIVSLGQDEGKVKIYHGLMKASDQEECYLIDNDFFADGRTELKDADRKLDFFHGQSGRLFRWCVDNRLHTAMEPKVLL